MVWLILPLTVCVFLGAFLRFYQLGNLWLTCETHNILWGIRLHHLGYFNFKAGILDNFFKSLFIALGGIRYALSGYLSAALYKVFHVPLTEFWVLAFHAFLGTLLILAAFWVGKQWGSPMVGSLAAALVALNPGAIYSSRWDNGEPLVSMTVALAVLFLFALGRTKSPFKAFGFGLLLSVLMSTEASMAAPLLVLYSFFALSSPQEKPLERIKSTFSYFRSLPGLAAILPIVVTLAIQYWTWRKFGRTNHLGMFGLMSLNYSERLSFSTFLPRIAFVFNHYATYFGQMFYYLSLVAGVVVVTLRGLKDPWIKFSSIGVAYFFIAFVLLPNTLVRAEHLYICEVLNAIFFASVWVGIFSLLKEKGAKHVNSTTFNYAGICLIVFLFIFVSKNRLEEALARPQFIHPMKSIGYYIRHFGGKDATVMNLWNCSSGVCLNQLSEYYYGKQLIANQGVEFPRKLFCSGTASREEILSFYNIKDFTFYVRIKSVYHLHPNGRVEMGNLFPSSDLPLHKIGARKVAEVTHRNEVLAEIYSREKFPFVSMDLDQYDRLWAKEYGSYDKLIEGTRVGIISMFGSHFDQTRGY